MVPRVKYLYPSIIYCNFMKISNSLLFLSNFVYYNEKRNNFRTKEAEEPKVKKCVLLEVLV